MNADLISLVFVALLFTGAAFLRSKNYAGHIEMSCLGWLALAFCLVRMWMWEPFTNQGSSMNPHIPPSSLVVVNKQAYGWMWPVIHHRPTLLRVPKGDVVAFENPDGSVWIKRVVGVPGDRLHFNPRMGWFINGAFVAPPSQTPHQDASAWFAPHWGFGAIGPAPRSWRSQMEDNQAPLPSVAVDGVIPTGSVFVLGDNKQSSIDSRSIGFLSTSAIIGRVDFIKRPNP